MDRVRKAEEIEWLRGVFADNTVVVFENGGLSVAEMTAMRAELRGAGARMKVVKNRLAKIAVADTPVAGLSDVLKGPTAIAFAEDPSAAAKAVKAYAKGNDKVRILGGAMGVEVFDAQGVEALASMPSREELIASIVQAVLSPGAELIGAVVAPGAEIAAVLTTLEEREAA